MANYYVKEITAVKVKAASKHFARWSFAEIVDAAMDALIEKHSIEIPANLSKRKRAAKTA